MPFLILRNITDYCDFDAEHDLTYIFDRHTPDVQDALLEFADIAIRSAIEDMHSDEEFEEKVEEEVESRLKNERENLKKEIINEIPQTLPPNIVDQIKYHLATLKLKSRNHRKIGFAGPLYAISDEIDSIINAIHDTLDLE